MDEVANSNSKKRHVAEELSDVGPNEIKFAKPKKQVQPKAAGASGLNRGTVTEQAQ